MESVPLIIGTLVLLLVVAAIATSGKSSPQKTGVIGESSIAHLLARENRRGHEGVIMQNLFIPMRNGHTTEIDLLYITAKGIFVIESKNYYGWIFGNGENENWTCTLYSGKNFLGIKKSEKHHFYNPIRQNATHIKYLSKLLGNNIPMISLIVFSDRSVFKSLEYSEPNAYVSHSSNLRRLFDDLWTIYPDALTTDTINRIHNSLLQYCDVDGSKKEEHLRKMEERFSNLSRCPKCGGNLVARTAKRGPNAGGKFLGCSNYPNCTYTRNL